MTRIRLLNDGMFNELTYCDFPFEVDAEFKPNEDEGLSYYAVEASELNKVLDINLDESLSYGFFPCHEECEVVENV